MPDCYLYQQELQALSGQRTVPNVWVNGQHIGGNDEIQSAHRTGKLNKLLAGQSEL